MTNLFPRTAALAFALHAIAGTLASAASAGEIGQTTFVEALKYQDESLFVRPLSAGNVEDQAKLAALRACGTLQAKAVDAALKSSRSPARDYLDHQRELGNVSAKPFAAKLVYNCAEPGAQPKVGDPALDLPIQTVEIPAAHGGMQKMFTLTAFVDSNGICQFKSANAISGHFALLKQRDEETVGHEAAHGFFDLGEAIGGLTAARSDEQARAAAYLGESSGKLISTDETARADGHARAQRSTAGTVSDGAVQRRPGFSVTTKIAP